MKSILKNALVGVLLIAGTTKPSARPAAAAATTTAPTPEHVTLTNVKAALIGLIPTHGTITNITMLECIGDISWGNPAWLCSEINFAIEKNDATQKKNITTYNSLGGYLPYVRTISADATTNTVQKLVVITENQNIIGGIVFTKRALVCTAEYKTKDETKELLKKESLQSMFGLANRGLTSFYHVPTEYRGPLYTAAKVVGYLAGAGAILYGGKKFLNWYADATPLLNKIATQQDQINTLMEKVTALTAKIPTPRK